MALLGQLFNDNCLFFRLQILNVLTLLNFFEPVVLIVLTHFCRFFSPDMQLNDLLTLLSRVKIST